VNKGGQVTTVIVSVGGFLGMDTKDVAVPFQTIHTTMKDNKWWSVMNTTKDVLKAAPGYTYDKGTDLWGAEAFISLIQERDEFEMSRDSPSEFIKFA
jgi:hypothetical protein